MAAHEVTEPGTPCASCSKPYPYHQRDCITEPKYCAGCSAYTTHCAREHCQNCNIDDEGFPTEDCGYCYAEIGGVVRISVAGSELIGVEQLPTPDERHDLTATPFED
jgi:hypothetical protein